MSRYARRSNSPLDNAVNALLAMNAPGLPDELDGVSRNNIARFIATCLNRDGGAMRLAAVLDALTNIMSGNQQNSLGETVNKIASQLRVIDTANLPFLLAAPLNLRVAILTTMIPLSSRVLQSSNNFPIWDQHIPAVELLVSVLLDQAKDQTQPDQIEAAASKYRAFSRVHAVQFYTTTRRSIEARRELYDPAIIAALEEWALARLEARGFAVGRVRVKVRSRDQRQFTNVISGNKLYTRLWGDTEPVVQNNDYVIFNAGAARMIGDSRLAVVKIIVAWQQD